MGNLAAAFLVSAVCLCAFVVCVAAPTKVVSRITAVSFLVTGLGGLLCYSYGFVYAGCSLPLAAVRAALSTAYAFLGRNDFSAVSAAPFFKTQAGQILFWLLHMVALYTTAGTTLLALGASLIQRARLLLPGRGSLILIYGSHEGAVSFAREMLKEKRVSVVFVDESPEISRADVLRMGAILCSDGNALSPNRQFMRFLGIRRGRKNIRLYALHKNYSDNLDYAAAFLRAMEESGIEPERTCLTMLGQEEILEKVLLAGEKYGYGSVYVADEAELAARLLVYHAPPCRKLSFDEKGRAGENLHCLLIGFGRVGQAVLRQLVCNGQASGSRLRIDVVDSSGGNAAGYLASHCSQVLEEYDIRFLNCDARSRTMYEHLGKYGESFRYIVVCTGNRKVNEEIAEELVCHYSSLGKAPCIYICGYDGVRVRRAGCAGEFFPLYSRDVLYNTQLDRRAKIRHQIYCGDNGLSEEENWKNCGYFSRRSSRASAEFAPMFAWMAGKTEEEICREGWQPEGEMLENFGITEHMRWCAFHYVMGFSPMGREEHLDRARRRMREIGEKGSSSLRITRDLQRRKHACLRPWEELDALSEAENEVTDGNVDYKEMDRQEVLALGTLLAAESGRMRS